MRGQRLLLPVIPFLVCLPGTGLCEGNDAALPNGNDPPIPETAMATCQSIAAILAAYPALEVRTSEEMVQDLRDRSEGFGCRVLSSGPTSGIDGEVDPADAARGLLGDDIVRFPETRDPVHGKRRRPFPDRGREDLHVGKVRIRCGVRFGS